MINSAKKQTQQRLNLQTYLGFHRHAWRHGLRQLTKNPLATLLTIAVISITLVLPTGLLTMLGNLQSATQAWNKGVNLSVFVNTNATAAQVDTVRQEIGKLSGISAVNYISPEQGLTDFAAQTGLSNVLQTLGQNPLPGVFVITPVSQHEPELNKLQTQLSTIANVSTVKLDMQWVKRLDALIALLQHFTYGLAIILALAVLLIVGNTIRMNVQNYQEEIEVMKLIGAGNRFIRRPFLYSGVFYGLCAAIFSAVILDFFVLWLQSPLNELAALYNVQFSLVGLSLGATLLLILVGVALGFLGSWLVVDKYLRKIQPQ